MGKLHKINPYDNKDMKYLEDYDIALFISLKSALSMPREEYIKEKEAKVSDRDYYYTLKSEKIENFYIVEKEKDLKNAKIYPKLKEARKDEINMLAEILKYTDDMKEVLVSMKEDNRLEKELVDMGFERLGDGVLLKETEMDNIDIKERSVSWK